MVLFAGVRSRVDSCDAPKSLKGLPVTLIAASIVSLAFYGFAGVIDGLLGM
jgi:electron transport complex protein RnfA